jgi:hypothetical protein
MHPVAGVMGNRRSGEPGAIAFDFRQRRSMMKMLEAFYEVRRI